MKEKTDYKIKKSLAPDLVYEKMQDLISQNIWKLNEKIPAEAELAEMFGVNRFTVRMALQKLNTLGILETRIGDGTYVRSFSFERHMESIYHFYMTPELLDDVSDFRSVIEIECARLAISRHTPDELDELRLCCKNFESSITAYVNAKWDREKRQLLFEKFNDDDVALHTQICKMSHNELLLYAYTTAKEAIRKHMLTLGHQRIMDLNPGDPIPSIDHHWNIYFSIKEKNFRLCKKILFEMIRHDK